ncbi:MAG: host attachment protein [Roseiarcus sp.]|jgi:protein required for attachment to host cells
MTKLALPHDAFVFVGDGRKALFLRNDGDEKFPNLVTERVIVDDENPPTHEQGTDRPGRGFASAHASRHSAMETTDWHEIEEHRFAQRVSAALEALVRERGAPALLIVAPPRALADLRQALHADVKARVVGEIDKDLTRHPVWEIERHILA